MTQANSALYAFGPKLGIDLSLGENPLGCSLKVAQAMQNITMDELTHYPDPQAMELKLALAKEFGLKPENFFIANGSEAIMKLLPLNLMFGKDNVVLPETTFPFFADIFQQAKKKVKFAKMGKNFAISLEDLRAEMDSDTKQVIVCNPNNPTGQTLSKKDLIQFAKEIAPKILVVDEAAIHFAGESLISEINNLPNLLVLRTFSKAFGIAGLRLGFAVGQKEIIEKLNQNTQPFPVSSAAMHLAQIALKDKAHIAKSRAFVKSEKAFLQTKLIKLGFEIVPSESNLFLLRVTPLFTGSREFCTLLAEYDVSVVDGNAFAGLNNEYVRLSVRTRETHLKFLQILKKIFKEGL